MLKNYVLIALRSIRRDTFYSLLNILGLTTGITCALLLILFVTHELSYDRHLANADNIVRVVSQIREPDKAFGWNVTQAPTAPTIAREQDAVLQYARLFPFNRTNLVKGTESFFIEDMYGADSTIFEVFSWEMLKGDRTKALHQPNSIVLTESIAIRLFGQQDPIGQTVEMNGEVMTVTGVLADLPQNTHFQFDALVSVPTPLATNDNWGGFFVSTYLLLKEGTDMAQLQTELGGMYDTYMKPIFGEMGIKIWYELQPIASIHLHSKLEGETNGDIGYVYTFGAIALFMILIACINYMNLATARSAKRAKEVGLRKVMGSQRGHLIGQFLSESVLMAAIAVTLAFILAWLLLPFFNSVSGKIFSLRDLLQPHVLGIGLVLILVAGVVSGSYPAFFLSSFQPAAVLKGTAMGRSGGAMFRKGLVVLQFAISLIMLISTGIVYQQLHYMRSKDLGYNPQQVLTIRFPGRDRQPVEKYQTFRQKLLANPRVKSVASANQPLNNIQGRTIFMAETDEGMKDRGFRPLGIDENYLAAMGMTIKEGRGFSAELPGDTLNSVLVNEATVARLGWKEAIGKKIMLGSTTPQNDGGDGQAPPIALVVGVVKDFHQQSLYNAIEPLVLNYRPVNNVIHIRVDADEVTKTLTNIEATWKEVYPEHLFEYTFLDQAFEEAYQADQTRGKIFTAFSLLTVFIACLGLFGLATFTANQRTREIGVRKVLGASVSDIVLLLSREFTLLVVLAIPFAFLAAWYAMGQWLETFPYRVGFSVWLFGAGALIVLLIAWFTVAGQAFKAASANPTKSLRSE